MQWYKYFHEVKDEMYHSTRRSRVEWTFHLSPNENINFVPLHEWENISLFVLYNLHKDSYFWTNLNENVLTNDLSLSKTLHKFKRNRIDKWLKFKQNVTHTACPTLRGPLHHTNARTAPAAFAPRRVSHLLFLINLVLRANIQRLNWKY